MPINPIQRKSMTSFFLGVLVMLIIAVAVVGLLYVTVVKKDKEEEEQEVIAYVYALNQDVLSGQEITSEMVQEVKLTGVTASALDLIPSKIQGSDGTLAISPMVFGYKSKINLSQGTVLSMSMLYEGEQLQDSQRLVEYNMLTLPMDLNIGDYIDVRLKLPNGQDLIVVSKKEIKNIYGNTISLYLTEGEILMMNSAMVEAYIMAASNMYAIKYVEPGNQVAAQLTYTPTAEVQRLINSNPNITNEAKNSLASKFSEEVRTSLNTETGQYVENRLSNIETGMKEQIEAARAAREAYLSGLEGY